MSTRPAEAAHRGSAISVCTPGTEHTSLGSPLDLR
jgi:hypothetical protein